MGMYDTVYVSSDVAAAWRLQCRACGRRLYLLDRPSDRRFWHAWTNEEIEESERMSAETDGVFALGEKKRGEGCFLPEAYLPEQRRQRFMGELPHQWVELYGGCECGEFIERWIKFTDGVATDCRSERPALASQFFDEARDWG
jgi:hypothetical protein